jgi:predicted ester cyclase
MTTSEDSKAVARAFYESYNSRDLESAFATYIADEMVNHALGGALSAEGWMHADQGMLAAMSDVTMTVLEQAADGDKVFTRWVLEGTLTRSGTVARLEAVTIDVIADAKIVEHNAVADFTQFMTAMGA